MAGTSGIRERAGTAFRRVAIGAAACLWAVQAWAQQAPPAAPSYTMPATQVWDLAADSGEVYRIFVSYPAGKEAEAPEDGYPVLYVLDGNAYFASFAQARWVQEYLPVGKSIVVGVGYPTDEAWDVRRLKDFTAPLLDPPPRQWRALAQYESGARRQFLDFLTGKLREEIGRRHRVDPDRHSLFGHSLGGLFALYALYERPGAFHSIVAASPSMEWNAQGILEDERAFTARLASGQVAGRTSRLMVIVGDRDTDDDPEPARALVERLDRLSGHGLRVRLRRYPEEIHVSVPARSVTDVLRFAFEIR
ncbi:prolyl oligopeptidase family serine peptidase [Luteimonas sp. BDR2-5]|uniref:alpha/beta hydrolase n=1 Tax=Proluteimonas luteida TaxID=2878685 RepID=UPI001E2C2F46|nr:alpha/beta hydrolase-fold protein [Luteimonas sp. BDR2-5]MCD9028212.1 prolyl oligopeptidase family serine peptidase [Luteimonas sp. BDR2-5]